MEFSLRNIRKTIRSWAMPAKHRTFRRGKQAVRMLLESLEDRIVPANTPKGIVSLNVGAGVTAVTGAPSKTVPVFIDFDNVTAAGTNPGPVGGLSGGAVLCRLRSGGTIH